MIASPNYARFIYDGNGSKFGDAGPEGSDTIERVFERYFGDAGLASGQTAVDGRSDYGPFIAVGIPAGGLFTGAEGVKTDAEQAVYGGTEGEAYDACYHSACDDIDNINSRGLDEMSDAVAHAVNHFAFNLRFIPRPESAAKAKHGKRVKGKAVKGKYLGDLLRK
jgi:Zn-dependent M28 family amino/carboxypeptidase